jgi:hypothetical protein
MVESKTTLNRRNTLEPELNDNAASAPRPGRKTGAAAAAWLALLLFTFFLVCGVAAAAERPVSPGFPTVMLYVGSG